MNGKASRLRRNNLRLILPTRTLGVIMALRLMKRRKQTRIRIGKGKHWLLPRDIMGMEMRGQECIV